MAGETDLQSLIRSMSPSVSEETYVWGTIPARDETDAANVFKLFVGMPIDMLFREAEGWTVVLTEPVANEIGLQYIFPCKKITLNVYSSLEAVGFMAAVSNELKKLNVGINPVSGFYHDHLFVPVGQEEEAVNLLKKMAKDA